MSARFAVDDTALRAEFDRLLDMGAATAALEKILALQWAAGNAAVHVDTGSLRGSQEIDSDYAGGRWAGTVSFGGASPGFVNDPVVYAIYEKARGGHHDFRRPILAMSGQYRIAVRAHLERGH